MRASSKYKIVYCGRCIKTLHLLADCPNFEVAAVSRIEEFLKFPLFNTADWIFRTCYALTVRRKALATRALLNRIFRIIAPLASPLYRAYANYLDVLCGKDFPIIDFKNANETASFIRDNNVDLLIVNRWSMLPKNIIAAPRKGTINIHPSSLPQYRGSLPTLWTLKNGDRKTALTYMILSPSMDKGDIIAQYPIILDPDETSITLEKKIETYVLTTLTETLKNYLDGALEPQRQDHMQASTTGAYLEYMKIEWRKETARIIADKVNLYPYLWPLSYCYALHGTRKIHIRRARPCTTSDNTVALTEPGSFHIERGEIAVKCCDRIIRSRLFMDINWSDSLILLFTRTKRFVV